MEINQEYSVYSLDEYISAIETFARGDMLWFRGQENYQYKLLPAIYRNTTVDFTKDGKINSIYLAESMRMQQYYAKNYMFVKDSGTNTTEWLGNAQHFGVKTRFLDWSTSAIHSLIFALEKYFDPSADEIKGIPCVWVLRPQELNKRIVESVACAEYVKDEYNYVYKSSNPKNNWLHMDYIFNLAYFERYLERVRLSSPKSPEELKINPLFYYLAKFYIDGEMEEYSEKKS